MSTKSAKQTQQQKRQMVLAKGRANPPAPGVRMKELPGEDVAYRSVRSRTRAFRKQMPKDHPSIRILASLTLPKESPPVRVGSAYGSDPTATAKLFRRLNAVWPVFGDPQIPTDLPVSDTACFAFRDALRAFIYNFGLDPTDNATYTALTSINMSNSPSTSYPRYFSPLEIDLAISSVAPHGEFLYLGRNGRTDQLRGILMTAGTSLTITWPAAAGLIPLTNIVTTVRKFEADQWVEETTYSHPANAPATHVYFAVVSGYYAWEASVDLFGSNITTVIEPNVTVQSTGGLAASMWAQLPLPNVEDVLPVVKAYRVTSVSAMLTNTASPLNRQGQITGIQLPKESNWLDYLDFDTLASLMKSETLNVVNGMYGFLKPTSEDDFEMKVFQFTSSSSDIPVDYVFELIPESDFLAIHAQVITTNGQQGYWTPAYNVEYESVSQWTELRVSEADDNDLLRALQLLSNVPQWHENDFHFSDIWDWVKDAASSVWNGVKDVASTVGPLALAAAPLLL